MFTTAVFTIAKTWKNPKCPLFSTIGILAFHIKDSRAWMHALRGYMLCVGGEEDQGHDLGVAHTLSLGEDEGPPSENDQV